MRKSILFITTLLISAGCASDSTTNVISAFKNIEKSPKIIKYKNEKETYNRGGHLQGVQLTENSDYAIVTGSSDLHAYYAVVKLDEKPEVISVNKLMEKPFKHAGGFQIFRNLMAVGIEDNSVKDKSKVCIYNIQNPEIPTTEPIAVIDRKGEPLRATAGCVGITKYNNKALVLVGDWDSKHLDFYTCKFNQIGIYSPINYLLARACGRSFPIHHWSDHH